MRTTACSVSLLTFVLALACVKPPEAPPTATPGSAASIGAGAGATVGGAPAPAPAAATPAAPAAGAPAGGPQLPAWKHGENPFVGARYWTDPYAPAFLKSKLFKNTNPTDSALLAKIADNGGADWIGDWTPNVGNWVNKRVTMILKTGSLPLFIVYNLPKRDCGNHSAGGAEKGEQYRKWITAFANGIGNRRAAIILEPDGLGLMKKCLSEADQKERLELYKFAIAAFMALGNTAVYLDAGHSGWLPAQEIAARLKLAGIDQADGFSLNVSNYKATQTEVKYGKEISKLVGNKPFVIDTSRNGNGPPTAECKNPESEACWCNPPGRALGSPPSTQTADPLVHAYLWLKKPGESDGACNGGPKAGVFWLEKALELSRNAKY